MKVEKVTNNAPLLTRNLDEKEFATTHGLEIVDSLPNMENWWIFKEQIFPLSYKEENSSIPEIDSWVDDQRVLEWNRVESFLLHKKITLNDPLFGSQWHLRNLGNATVDASNPYKAL